jgi:cell wall-associated NlpC family hydrolase
VRLRFLLPTLTLAVPLAAAAAGTASPPTVAEKQSEAARVLAEIGRIDRQLSHTVDAYDGARVQLTALGGELRRNRAALVRARRTLRIAQTRLERRMVLIYTSEQPTALDILLGASSLSDLLDELDVARKVAAQDDEIAREAAAAKADLERREAQLERARRAQRQTVARLAATRAHIQSALARRRQLLGSIRTEIVQIRARERARERRLAAEARARLRREHLLALAAQRERERVRAQRRAAAATTTSASRAPSAPAAPAAPPPSPPPASSSPPSPPSPPTPPAPPSSPPAPPPPPATSGQVGAGHPEAATIAARYLGVPYRWGGASPSGFDCSGLVMYVYAQLGISLPHYTVAQYRMGVAVSRSQLQPGDLVFFDGLGHVGIYIGQNQFIHAPHTGDVVKVSSITGWYARTYVGARRI